MLATVAQRMQLEIYSLIPKFKIPFKIKKKLEAGFRIDSIEMPVNFESFANRLIIQHFC